jgi:O-methyltransferase
MVPIQELMIYECSHEVKHLDGDVVEIGVHQGESAEVICNAFPDSSVFLFDTYTGMPPSMITKGLDTHRVEDFSDTSLARVQKRLSGKENAALIAGVFPESAKVEPKIKFAHIDVDLYESTKAALEWCWPRMVEGGVILDDDYHCSSCPGAKKAVDEFVSSHNATCEVKNHRAILRRHP